MGPDMTSDTTPDDVILDTLADLADQESRKGNKDLVWTLESVITAFYLDTGIDPEAIRQKILDRRRKRIAKEHEALLSIDQSSSGEKPSMQTRRAVLVVDNRIPTREITANGGKP